MEKTWFVGIDVSKSTLDFAFCQQNKQRLNDSHFKTENNKKGFIAALKWLQSKGIKKKEMWVCMEHTGEYTLDLWKFLEDKQVFCTVANAVNIKDP